MGTPITLKTMKADTRDAVIDTLAKTWPLNARQVYSEVRDTQHLNITYQGVHKVLNQLVKEKIAVTQDRKYELDAAWIKSLRKFAETADKNYSKVENVPYLEIGTGSSVEKEAFTAGKEAAEKALAKIKFNKTIQLALVFTSVAYEETFSEMIRGIQSIIGKTSLAGCSSMGGEIDNKPLSKSVVVVLVGAAKDNFSAETIVFQPGEGYFENDKLIGANGFFDRIEDKNFNCGIIFFPGFMHENKMHAGEAARRFLELWNTRTNKIPIVGGLAGDDWRFQKTWMFCGDKVFSKEILFIGIKTKVKFAVGMEHAYEPVKDKVYLTHVDGSFVTKFSTYNSKPKPATEVYSQITKIPTKELEKIIPTYIKESISQNKNPPLGIENSFLLAFPVLVRGKDMQFEIDFKEGERIKIMKTTPKQMLETSLKTMELAIEKAGINKLYGAIVFPCGVFDLILARLPREIDYLKKKKEFHTIPLAGCYVAGEIGVRDGQDYVRGNGTFATLVFGE